MAQSYSGRGLAIAIALASAASVTALIVLEYLALGRLIHWLLSTPLASTLGAIAVPFLAADALSLINPDRFYNDLLQPSLIALFLAQLIVVAVYPVYRLRTQRSVSAAAFAISTIAVALFGYGLYTAISAKLGS